MPKAKRATIRMVAAEAGVSTATVSYVLSGRAHGSGISDDTSDQVRLAAKKLGYRPNQVARNIRTGRTDSLLLSLTNLSDPWALSLAHVVSETAKPMNLATLIMADGDWASVLRRQSADAIFIDELYGIDSPEERLRELARSGLKMVVFNNEITPDGFDVMSSSSIPGCELAMEHLLETHTKIGCLVMSESMQSDRHPRFSVYLDSLRRAGIVPRDDYIETYTMSTQSAFAAATRLLSQDDRPTAIYAVSDFAALIAINAAARLGLSVPDDVEIIGIGNAPDGKHSQPPLTTVGPTDFFQSVADLLVHHATSDEMPPGEIYHHPWSLIVRGSTH